MPPNRKSDNMDDQNNIPTILEFLAEIDPKGTISRDEVGREIAILALISAPQYMTDELTKEQQVKVNQILEDTKDDTTGELLQYFEVIGKKEEYLEQVAETTSFWTIDFMVTLYKSASDNMRNRIDEKWPELSSITRQSTE